MEKILMRKSYKGSDVLKIVDNAFTEVVQDFGKKFDDPYITAFLILIQAEVRRKLFEKEEK